MGSSSSIETGCFLRIAIIVARACWAVAGVVQGCQVLSPRWYFIRYCSSGKPFSSRWDIGKLNFSIPNRAQKRRLDSLVQDEGESRIIRRQLMLGYEPSRFGGFMLYCYGVFEGGELIRVIRRRELGSLMGRFNPDVHNWRSVSQPSN